MRVLSLIGLCVGVCASAEPLLEGRVRLESGEPVAAAQVRLFDLTDLQRGAIARAQTDDTGYFALPLAALAGSVLPEDFTLGPNYPNPFNPSTIIPYQLATASEVRLEVFNLLGQRLTTLVDEERSAGFHTATWNATDAAGRAVGAGVYIYRMTVGAASQTGRMVLIDGQAGVAVAGVASDWLEASDSGGLAKEAVYGLIVEGSGLVYVDSSFRVEAGMAPVELVVSSGSYSAGKAADDDCALCDLFGAFGDAEEEEETEEEAAETDSTASEGGPDLIVQPPSASAVVLTPGQAFTLQVTVHNQGDEQAAATMLHYYRSNNATISASDTEVGTGAVDALDASATSAESIALTASVGVEKYYGACVDSVSGESNTDNNCSAAVKITVSGQEATEDEDETSEEETDETPKEAEEDPPKELPDDALVTIPDANLRAAVAAELGKARGAPITVAEMKTLRRLEALFVDISDLTGLEYATNLNSLKLLFNNDIRDISVLSGLTNLTSLSFPDNAVSDISALAGLTNLISLGFSGNNISDISVLSGLTRLETLDIGKNPLSDISALAGLTNLRRLVLSDSNIRDISVLSGLTNLVELDLKFNNISDISVLSGLTRLETLDIRGNLLSDSSINDHIPALKSSDVTVRYDFWRVVGDFDIELVLLSDFTERQKRELQYGIRRWMAVITKDLPDYTFTQNWSGQCGGQSYEIPAGERIDDLRIYVSRKKLQVAGYGGPDLLRAETQLPVFGCMVFNSEAKNVQYLTLHETAHVLGVGTLWDALDFLQDYPDGDAHFNGLRAIAAFDDAGGRGYAGKKVPVSQDGGHWRGSVFGSGEVMIAGNGAISAITVQSLADLGYGVDVTQADPYTLPSAAAKASAKIAAPSTQAEPKPVVRHRHRQQREPIYVVDPRGNIVRTLHR